MIGGGSQDTAGNSVRRDATRVFGSRVAGRFGFGLSTPTPGDGFNSDYDALLLQQFTALAWVKYGLLPGQARSARRA
jgi:hypothetical protein